MKDIRSINIWKEKPQDGKISMSVLENTDIEVLGLNQRSYNGLKRAGVTNIAQVLEIVGEDGEGIKSVRNLGEKSRKEIMDKLDVFMESYKAANATSYTASSNRKKILLKPDGMTWNRDISSVGLSADTAKQLRQSGIFKVGDIYSPAIKDPGWIAVRELLDRIVNEAC